MVQMAEFSAYTVVRLSDDDHSLLRNSAGGERREECDRQFGIGDGHREVGAVGAFDENATTPRDRARRSATRTDTIRSSPT